MKPRLPALVSINGRDLGTAGFLALHGPFTAHHVTGNFVTFAAETVLGTFEYCGQANGAADDPDAEFPAIGACRRLYLGFGPFVSGNGWLAILTGITMVSAMAVQNALRRVHLGTAQPPTMMTGTTTQIMIDIADLLHGVEPEAKAAAKARLGRMAATLGGFVFG